MLTHQELDGSQPLHRRRKYLLYPFQTRYALAVVLLTAFVSSVISLVGFRLFGGFSPQDTALLGTIPVEHNLRWLLSWIFFLIISSFGFFYLLVVLVSHRLAGPLTVMTKYMSELADGRYPQIRELRRNDELKEFFALFKSTIEKFKSRDLDEIQLLRTELKRLEGLKLGPASQQLESSLQLLLERRLQATGAGLELSPMHDFQSN